MITCSATKDNQIQQRVGPQAVCAMDRHASTFTNRIQTIDDCIRDAVFRHHYLTVNVGRNSTHLIMDRRHDRNGLFERIHVSKLMTNFQNRWKTFFDGLGANMA